tara:strand:+ start:83 stop:577 length:495 start_codon:yes stop_codon:yes gene_type:complete
MPAEDTRRMTPLMLSNKRAVIRINSLIDRVDGDVSSTEDLSIDVSASDGIIIIDKGLVNLHTAVGYEGKHIAVKVAGTGSVTIKAADGETIDDNADILLSHYQSIEIVSDNINWWIMGSYIPIKDAQIIELLQTLVRLNRISNIHMAQVTDIEIEEEEFKDEDQ